MKSCFFTIFWTQLQSHVKNRVVKVERTLQLAKRLMQDIKERKLKSGDSYYTTLEAAAWLGVAGTTASRALQLLEKRHVLKRRQRTGAIIINPSETTPVIDYIHFLSNYRLSALGEFGHDIITGIRDEFPQSHISFTLLKSQNEVKNLKKLLAESNMDQLAHAFVMLSSSPAIQKIVSRSGCPHVLLGTKCPGVPPMSQLDIGHKSALWLLFNHLTEMQRTRIAVILRRTVLPGDTSLVNTAIRLEIPNCFFLQHNEDDPCCVDELCELIQTQFDPNGVICQSSGLAEAFQKALVRLGKPLDQTEITVLHHREPQGVCYFTHTATQLSVTMMGRRLGQLLYENALGLKPQHEVIPMRLVLREKHNGNESSENAGLANAPSWPGE